MLAAIARREWLLACTRLAALSALACGRSQSPYDRRSTVILAYDQEELKPDADLLGNYLIYLPLVQHDARGNLHGRLAKSWERSADSRQWTFHLRDVTWHDGAPVTAHDVKFTLDVLMHPDLSEEAPGTWDPIVLDDRTIRIRAGNYGHSLLTRLVYYPKHLLKDVPPKAFYRSEFWMRPIGNGPYRFVRYSPATMMELEANPDFYRGKPRIRRVVLRFSRTAGITQLLSGEVDAMTLSDRALIRTVKTDPRFRVYHWYRGERARAIYWNHTHPLFRDVRVRQALTLAINRPQLRQLLDIPTDVPIVDGFYTERQLLRGDLPASLPYDPAQARALFDAAGCRDPGDGGVRRHDGRSFRFSALVSKEDSAIGVYVQDQLRRVGVQMDIRVTEGPWALVSRGEFEAAIFQIWRSSHWGAAESPFGYRSPDMIGLLDQLKDTADPDSADRLHRRMTEIFQRDVPATMLFPYIYTVVAHRRIRGLASPFRADPAGYMEDLWLDDRDVPR